jgi:saccharopine dehydrogenase-like NADP-dependent oxidoreductase
MWDKLLELDLFNSTKIVGLKMLRLHIRRKILSDNWTLEPDDKDMIVMYHKFGYELDGAKKQIDSKMVCIGEETYTAMAKTVGFTVAMATLLILNGKITTPECNYLFVKKCINRY